MQDFRQLKVWAKAHTVALEIFKVTERLPRHDGLALRSQLRRAALSIPEVRRMLTGLTKRVGGTNARPQTPFVPTAHGRNDT